ncbi:MAG: class I SAM-dependent methyltransferase [Methylobacteriaceae bacterium]|nr:class I SAM-dependent methyltransferase [Methylobacteriaceae bacterium]MBV9704552.1 class I SAM-dependent methyltransferase [Methylobacteriaceae bacterium]
MPKDASEAEMTRGRHTRVRDAIFKISPYLDLDLTHVEPDLQGWRSDSYILMDAIDRIRPSLILEIGTWKGRSAINMARRCKALGLSTEIVCIDTWLGCKEHWLNKDDPDHYDSLKIRNGFPGLYWTFLKNVADNEMQGFITPLPLPSDTAFHVLSKLNVHADMIYIDGSHEYESVTRDLTLYWELLSENGLLIGDDYVGWDGVTRAANDFAKSRKLRITGQHGKFVLSKGVPVKICFPN